MIQNVDLVVRSCRVRSDEDAALQKLAVRLKVSKSDLMRSAISIKLREWLAGKDTEIVRKDLEVGHIDIVGARPVIPRKA